MLNHKVFCLFAIVKVKWNGYRRLSTGIFFIHIIKYSYIYMYVSDSNYEALKKRNETKRTTSQSPLRQLLVPPAEVLFCIYSFQQRYILIQPSLPLPCHLMFLLTHRSFINPILCLNSIWTSSHLVKQRKMEKNHQVTPFFFFSFLGFPNLDSLLSSFSIAQT